MSKDSLAREIGEFIVDDILDNSLSRINLRKQWAGSFEYKTLLAEANEGEDSRQRLIYEVNY
jgi:hypothetical protein